MNTTEQKPEIVHQEAVTISGLDRSDSLGSHPSVNRAPHRHHGHQGYERKVADPQSIGIGSFGVCTFILGLYQTGLVTDIPQVALGVAFGIGALGQAIAGITDLVLGNTFGATAMLTYSGFWLSFGIMFSSGSGFLEAAEAEGVEQLNRCLGLWQVAFLIPSFCFLIGALKLPWLLRFTLLLVVLSLLFGSIGAFTGVAALTKAGGWVSFLIAVTAWYMMSAILYTPENTYISLPFF